MKELKEGRISYKELADWFGVSYVSIKRISTRQKKLEILKFYADFHIETTKSGKQTYIVIDKVKEPIYTKIKERYSNWESTWDINGDGVDTVKNASNNFYNQNPDLKVSIAPSTNYNYYGDARREDYGRAVGLLKGQRGKKGISYRVWAQEIKPGKYRVLTKEELDKINEIKESMHLNVKVDADELRDLRKEYKNMSEEEKNAANALLGKNILEQQDDDQYLTYLGRIAETLGFMPKRVIVHQLQWED